MTFRPRNAYYLRISSNVVLPLFLYLDERHIDWMSDLILQHVLADLRPLVIPKLQAEKEVHFGAGAVPGTKRGTVEVHRGETYQFAYFFRKIEPHTILFKSRYFVTAPLRPEVVSRPTSPRPADRNSQKKRSRTQVSAEQSKRKHAETKGKGKGRFPQSHLGEDGWTAEKSEEEDMYDTGPVSREPRPVRKQRRIINDAYQEDDDDDVEVALQDIAMQSPPLERGEGLLGDPDVLVTNDEDAAAWDANDQPSLSPDVADVELLVEDEEQKPKPLLKLKYKTFSISGQCLCVVVEPWPPQRAETRLRSVGLGTSSRRGLEPFLRPPDVSTVAGQRAKTPLFFAESDRALSEAPFAGERTLPPVPLFHDAMSSTEEDYSEDDLMNFSQTLNAVGHMHAITADDDDDMDGAVLFGDADEVRELH